MNALKVLSKRMLSWLIARAATIKDKSGKEHAVSQPLSLGMASLQESGDPEDLIEMMKSEMDSLLEGKFSGAQLNHAAQALEAHIKKDKHGVLEHFLSGFEGPNGSENKALTSFKSYVKQWAKSGLKVKDVSINAPVGDDGKATREDSTADKGHNTEKQVEDKAGAAQKIGPIKGLLTSLDSLIKTPAEGKLKELGFDSFGYVLKLGGISKDVWESGIKDISENADKCDVNHLDVCRNVMADVSKLMPFIKNLINVDTGGERSKKVESGKMGVFFSELKKLHPEPEELDKHSKKYMSLDNAWAQVRGTKSYIKKLEEAGNKQSQIEKAKKNLATQEAELQSLLAKGKNGGTEDAGTAPEHDSWKFAESLWRKMRNHMDSIKKKSKDVVEALAKLQDSAKQAYLKGMALRKQGMLSKRCLAL